MKITYTIHKYAGTTENRTVTAGGYHAARMADEYRLRDGKMSLPLWDEKVGITILSIETDEVQEPA